MLPDWTKITVIVDRWQDGVVAQGQYFIWTGNTVRLNVSRLMSSIIYQF